MRRFSARSLATALVAFSLQLVPLSPTQASRRLPIAISMLAALQSSGVQSFCFTYAFDRNGNRLSKTNLTWGSGTWGSSVYGCFNWRT